MMGKGRGEGGGDGSSGLSRFRFFRAIFGGRCSWTNAYLEKVAIARGLHSVDELLVQLGKQETGVSKDEAFNLLEKELGISAVEDVIFSRVYAGGMNGSSCQKMLRRYKEAVESKDELMVKIRMDILTKHCGYNGNGEKCSSL